MPRKPFTATVVRHYNPDPEKMRKALEVVLYKWEKAKPDKEVKSKETPDPAA